MSPRGLAALITGLLYLLKAHLSITAGGVTVSLFLPWVIVAALAAFAVILLWLCVRSLRGFRSSPYPRTAI
jgi:hypothetical protein